MDDMTTPVGDAQDPMAPKPMDENAEEETTEENGEGNANNETTEA